jgi:phosphoribosylanthranilate isomerase
MPAPLIKICGLSTPQTIRAAADSGASHVGLVHFGPSPRHVDLDRAATLRREVPRGVRTVVLVVDPDGLTLANIAETLRPDAIQFHGKEPPEALAAARARFGCQVWKALPVRGEQSLQEAALYAEVADLVLLDAPAPEGSALPGGNGEAFGWDILKGHAPDTPWGLAGGLTPDNVAEAIRVTGAPLVDVSSGVESAPGIKDVDKIAAFCKAARTYD